MTANGNGNPPTPLLQALQHAWQTEKASVDRFGLRFVEPDIRQDTFGWTVPVASGVPTGSAYELSRALSRIQEQVENESQLNITLFLDPFTGQPVKQMKG